MTDNVAVTPGTGKTVLADEITHPTLGTGVVQLVKLVDGTVDGTTGAAVGANGLKVDGSGVTQPISAADAAAYSDTTLAAPGGIVGLLKGIFGKLSNMLSVANYSSVWFQGTTAALAAGATYTGTSRPAGSTTGNPCVYSYFNGSFFMDQAGTASIEVSNTGAFTGEQITLTSANVSASVALVLSVPVMYPFHRAKLANTSGINATITSVNTSYTGG